MNTKRSAGAAQAKKTAGELHTRSSTTMNKMTIEHTFVFDDLVHGSLELGPHVRRSGLPVAPDLDVRGLTLR